MPTPLAWNGLTLGARLPTLHPVQGVSRSGGPSCIWRRKTEIYFGKQAILSTRFFKGAKPADLPVEQPTKFELVVDLDRRQLYGWQVPINSVSADEVIEVANAIHLYCGASI